MKTYGGFIGLEPSSPGRSRAYHDGTALTTGRSCLKAVVDAVQPARVHVPFYMCDALLQPLRAAGVACVFYSIDFALTPVWRRQQEPVPDGDLFVFVNYFGLIGREASAWALRLGQRAVIDDAQAFFHQCPTSAWSFNSARKFFGVPDGAYLSGPPLAVDPLPAASLDLEYLVLRVAGHGDPVLAAHRRHEAAFDDAVRMMSAATAARLNTIDYAAIARRRRANFRVLDDRLGSVNRLRLRLSGDDVPCYYPFLPPVSLRDELIRQGVFVPCFWAEVAARPGGGFAWERELASWLCPLPVDHRYDDADMREVASRVTCALDS